MGVCDEGDIHPTYAGYEVLAELLLSVSELLTLGGGLGGAECLVVLGGVLEHVEHRPRGGDEPGARRVPPR